MAVIRFRYRRERSDLLGGIFRPVAEVHFRDEAGQWFISFMYVDSGADITLIPRSFGESLGFQVKQREIRSVRGVGNVLVPVLIRRVRMRIGNREFEARVAWSLEEDVPPLLGRTDVFDEFDILFRQRRRITEFEPLRRRR